MRQERLCNSLSERTREIKPTVSLKNHYVPFCLKIENVIYEWLCVCVCECLILNINVVF